MFCKNCGSSLPDDVKFCPNCGTENTEDSVPSNGVPSQKSPNAIVGQQEPVPLSQWCWLLLNFIPFIGGLIIFVLIIVWAVGNPKTDKYPCRVNFARASLIMMLITFVLIIIGFVLVFALAATGNSNY